MKQEIKRVYRWMCMTLALLALSPLPGGSDESPLKGAAGSPQMKPHAHQLPSFMAPLSGSTALAASEKPSEDMTLSPFFFIPGEDTGMETLPLKSTSAEVTISGSIADIRVTQTYRNDGKKAIEATYVFPASTRAAVHGMRMIIGERTITAEIQKREEARRTYEEARQEGKSASLLEQQRPNVFQMSVANIMPGDTIQTVLQYTEMLVPTDGTYELVYPTVVGPRYSRQPPSSEPPEDKWVSNPYLHQGEKPTYSLDLKVHLSTGIPIQEVTSPSHAVDIRFLEPSRVDVHLKKGEAFTGNRDFILQYRLAGKQIQSGLLLYEGEKESFFLLTVEPPERVTPKDIPPREYVFIVDVSGSMHGFPLDVSKNLLKNLLQSLRRSDSFNVLLFSGGSSLLSERSLPATAENIRLASDLIERQRGGGGTELLPALEKALALPAGDATARVFVIVSDGYVSVETESFDLLQKRIGQASFFSFGIGSSVNRFLIEGLARAGAGESLIITKPEEAAAKAEQFRKLIESPVLTHIRLSLGQFDAYDLEPIGIPDLFAARPVVVSGKWRGRPEGRMTLSGMGGMGSYHHSLEVSSTKPNPAHKGLESLWARSRVARIADYNRVAPDDERARQLTNLGLQYHLLTTYTSFVAVDSQVRRQGGDLATVTQPLPLPEGVSDHAVGRRMGVPVPMKTPKSMTQSVPPSLPDSMSAMSGRATLDTAPQPGEAQRESGGDGQSSGRGGKPRLRALTVEGFLTEQDARASLEGHLPSLSGCRGKRRPDVETITLTITVEASGRVRDVRATALDPISRKTERCILKAVRAWRFPGSASGGTTVVTVTLEL